MTLKAEIISKLTDQELAEKILLSRIEKLKETLTAKKAEYAKDEKPYQNFDKAAMMRGCTPAQALWGYLMKHIISVQDMVDTPKTEYPIEFIEEKIGDCMAYLVLLEGLLKRPHHNKTWMHFTPNKNKKKMKVKTKK